MQEIISVLSYHTWDGPFSSDPLTKVNAVPMQAFWQIWRSKKHQVKAAGISVAKVDDRWCITRDPEKIVDDEAYHLYITGVSTKQPVSSSQVPTASGKIIKPDISSVTLKYPDIPHAYQVDHLKQMIVSVRDNGYGIDGSDTGTGKCLGPGTPIIMYDGSIKKVEDIEIGDLVMGDDSTPRKVLSLDSGTDTMYQITPVKGEPFICNEPHVLTLRCTADKKGSNNGLYKKDKVIDIPLSEYLKKTIYWKHMHKLFRVPVEFTSQNIDIDPYIYGLWLADGSRHKPEITKHPDDYEIIEYMIAWAASNKYTITQKQDRNTIGWYFSRGKFTPNPLYQFLQTTLTSSGAKYILPEYQVNSRQVRLQVLAGLLDGDGYKAGPNTYEIVTKYDEMRDGILFIARSLGFMATTREKKGTIKELNFEGLYHRIFISGDTEKIPLKLTRKKAAPRKQVKNVLNTGFSVENLGKGQYYGFEIDGNGRFLLGDFTVTHNTPVGCLVAAELGLDLFVLAPKTALPAWRRTTEWTNAHLIEVINYEKIRNGSTEFLEVKKRGKGKSYTWKIPNPENTLIIWDEAHRCKDQKTINAKMMIAAKDQGYRMLPMTATCGDNPLHFYAIGYALELFDKDSYWKWATAHGIIKDNFDQWCFPTWLPESNDHLRRIHQSLYPYRGSRMRKAELGDVFPENLIIAEAYQMNDTTKIEKIYKEMRKEIRELKKKTSTDGSSELTIRLRARQEVELLKVPAFVEMAKDLIDEGNSVVIFVNFRETVRAVQEKLSALIKRLNPDTPFTDKFTDKGSYLDFTIQGGQKADDREAIRQAFQDDKLRCIVANSKAGGISIDLHDTHGNYPRVSIISPPESGTELKQVFGRIHRSGSMSKAIQKMVFAAGTIEEKVCQNVNAKIDRMDIINDGDLVL